MKQTLRYALFTVLGLAVVAPAMAQNFPDVPENHWAYEALDNLKREGILVGYPDGLFRGPRNATRYELAIAIHATYKKLMGLHTGLSEQVTALQEKIDGMGGGGGDLTELKNQLSALQSTVDGMKGWGDDVASLKKLAEKFEKELASLGVDVAALQKDLTDIEKRLTEVEKRKPAVDISGDASILVLAGNSRDGDFFMGKDGGIAGTVNGGPAGMTKNLNVYHEVGVTLKGTNTEGPKWYATLVYGNALGNAYANQIGGAMFTEGPGDFYIQDLVASFDTSLASLGFSAQVGRIPVSVSPWLFQKSNATYYYDNPRWDDGKYRMDGGKVDFKFGGVDLAVFAGKNSSVMANNGTLLNPTGSNTTLGAQLGVPLGALGKLNAAYIYHDSDAFALPTTPNRLNVFGGDVALKLGPLDVTGGYSKTVPTHNTKSISLMDRYNQAAFATVAYKQDRWGAEAAYEKVQKNYAANGDWGRIGTMWNPTNYKAFKGKVHFALTNNITLGYAGLFGKTIDVMGIIPRDSDIQSHNATLGYKLNEAWTATLGYEDVKVKGAAADAVRQKWASLNLGYTLGTNSTLKLGYEYGSVNNNMAWGNGAAGSYRGGLLTTQFSIKF